MNLKYMHIFFAILFSYALFTILHFLTFRFQVNVFEFSLYVKVI